VTPGWENIRLGLANSHQPRPRWDMAKHPGRFWLYVAVSAALWLAIFTAATLAFR
jgi:hypothetical protein